MFQPQYKDKIWVEDVRECLEQQLYNYLIDDNNDHSCDAVKKYAFSSHVDCYVEPDI